MARAQRTTKKRASAKGQSYNEDSIQVQEGLKGIRLNPSMYLGALGNAMVFRMVKETVDNFYDEYAAGRNTGGEIIFDPKTNEYIIADYAQGIPVGLKQTEHEGKVSTLTLIFTKVHAGGKFDASAYATSSGTHGVGISAVNAVSQVLEVWTHRDKAWYYQQFKQGEPVAKLKKIGSKPPAALKKFELAEKKIDKYGTIVRFVPDQTVVSEDAARGARKKKEKDLTIASLDYKVAGRWLKDLAMLNPGLKITLRYKGKGSKVFHNSKGLEWLVQERIREEELNAVLRKPFVFQEGDLACSVTWTDAADDEHFTSYVNSSPTVEHGTHVEGFRSALMKAIKPHLGAQDKKKKFTVKDLMIGACGVINFRMNSAQYSSQVKDKLVSKVSKDIDDMLSAPLLQWFKENPRVAKNIIKKATTANDARESLKKVMQSMTEVRKGSRSIMPKNLVEAPGVKPDEREIYLVEGDSAGGTAKDARNNNQEILKLSGKILNCLNASLPKILSSQAVLNMIISLGVDPGSLDINAENPKFSTDKLRCARVYLLSDPDPDGAHINTLLLAFFFKLMPEFIKQGRLFVVEGKLYNAMYKGTLYSGDTYNDVAEQIPDTAEARKTITRVKGWGEINADMLDPIAFDPDVRQVRRITWNDDPERITYFKHIAAESAAEKRKLLGLRES